MLLNYAIGEDLRVPWSTRRSNQSTVKEISPEFIEKTDASWSSNTLAIWCEELIHWKRPWCWERLKARGEGDDRIRILDGITDSVSMSLSNLLGVGDEQGGLVCCSPWGRKESDTTEWTELMLMNYVFAWKYALLQDSCQLFYKRS